ncbi:iron-sulfur cluster assembly protein SufD [Nitzschia inconspicua]|uniref:Iron-sulfur cluster assembly protein SufD n=1 Tax=Nitzschia inconspicua TaxID=303405 RepID=A0A9K3PYZ6_9STRA|nr:iron-sulfur cluster assembly protein SufD [Nitzschia inconspicua]
MRLILSNVLLLAWCTSSALGFSSSISSSLGKTTHRSWTSVLPPLHVSIGLGPDKKMEEEGGEEATDDPVGEEKKQLVAGVDYEIPDHESFRTSRRSKLDEQCDVWFGALLGGEDDKGVLGELADEARKTLLTPVPLVNEEKLPRDHEEYTPYVSTKLPWTPLVPAFGLEEFGLPVPRRNAEAWRHFDVASLVAQSYSGSCEGTGKVMELTDDQVKSFQAQLESSGSWLADDACQARLVYINGRYAPQLSVENDLARNMDSYDSCSEEIKSYLSRLTDGFTDELVTPVQIGDDKVATSYKKLSGPDHCLGEPFSQFAINTQQGTACFAALNTRRTGAVAYVHIPEGKEGDETGERPKPVLILNAVTKNGGAASESEGMAFHPRCLVVAEKYSRLSIVQSSIDLDDMTQHVPKFYNGYTQIFVKDGANVTHSYLEESGGMVTAGVEMSDDSVEKGQPLPREIEAARPELKDTHFEAIDVHVMGDDGKYEGTIMSFGGSGRVRVAHSVSLLRPGSHATINGFSLSGGAQRTDCKTNIHHVAQGTTSEQIQKNMIGGRSTGAFRGRIRVEQSAQQTDSQQLSRSVLLSDRARAWSIPSLEIIADDVKCTHGATVSDLSEEELFYLRSRGLDRTLSRNLLMYAFANDVCTCVDPAMLTSVDSDRGLQKRLIQRLENVVPQGDRAVKGEFQSI